MPQRYWYLLIVVVLALGSVFGLRQFFTHESITPSLEGDTNSVWQECSGPDLEYSFSYPNNFRVWQYSPGAYVPRACTDIKNANQVVLETDLLHDPRKNRIDFDWIDGSALSSLPRSINDFFAQSPDILKNSTILKRAPLGGEESVWIQQPDGG